MWYVEKTDNGIIAYNTDGTPVFNIPEGSDPIVNYNLSSDTLVVRYQSGRSEVYGMFDKKRIR